MQSVNSDTTVTGTQVFSGFIYPSDNSLHNYVITRNGNSVKCYVDGIEIIQLDKRDHYQMMIILLEVQDILKWKFIRIS